LAIRTAKIINKLGMYKKGNISSHPLINNFLLSYTRKSSKRGLGSNPAVRLIRNRIDSAAAQLIRKMNSSGQGSSSIGVKSGTFQWRKESQM
jgi:hypothetical protein